MAKNNYKVVLSDRVVDQIRQIPRKEQVKLYEAFEKLSANPYLGTPVIPKELDKIIVCKKCGSSDTISYMDIGCEPPEIHFQCNSCGESFWCTAEDTARH